MNAIEIHATQGSRHDFADRTESVETVPQTNVRHVHHVREFGIGYGNSSGYASGRNYAPKPVTTPFRFA